MTHQIHLEEFEISCMITSQTLQQKKYNSLIINIIMFMIECMFLATKC